MKLIYFSLLSLFVSSIAAVTVLSYLYPPGTSSLFSNYDPITQVLSLVLIVYIVVATFVWPTQIYTFVMEKEVFMTKDEWKTEFWERVSKVPYITLFIFLIPCVIALHSEKQIESILFGFVSVVIVTYAVCGLLFSVIGVWIAHYQTFKIIERGSIRKQYV